MLMPEQREVDHGANDECHLVGGHGGSPHRPDDAVPDPVSVAKGAETNLPVGVSSAVLYPAGRNLPRGGQAPPGHRPELAVDLLPWFDRPRADPQPHRDPWGHPVGIASGVRRQMPNLLHGPRHATSGGHSPRALIAERP
jgi:hypothetical protein